MNKCRRPEEPASTFTFGRLIFLFFFLVGCILAITWPWVQVFPSGFIAHWDPPFHAWKLEYVAQSILSGHLLPPNDNTNMYYPNSGALYYEALHWPEAFFAAGLLAIFDNPILVYHLTMVSFWALSGVCLWMLLVALKTTRAAALMGAVLFTIIPYRTSYVVEFNMQLCFGMVLFLYFLVRYFQKPSAIHAAGIAIAWWLQASSELYQAVFLVLVLPFIVLPMISGRWSLLQSRREFWIPVLVALAIAGSLTAIFLLPYMSLLQTHTLERSLVEVERHCLEVFSYLLNQSRYGIRIPVDAKHDEMSVYPTLCLGILSLLALVYSLIRHLRSGESKIKSVARLARLGLILIFLIVSALTYFKGLHHGREHLLSLLPVLICFASLVVTALPSRETLENRMVEGLFSGALFAFFMGLGPYIEFRHSGSKAINLVYMVLYHYLDELHGFRVVSRFSVFVMIFIVVIAAVFYSEMQRKWPTKRWLGFLWMPLILLVALESVPSPFRTRPVDLPLKSAVLDRLDKLDSPYVIAMAPMGSRDYDSVNMLQIAGVDRLFVYAWGGTYPPYTKAVQEAISGRTTNPEKTEALLRQLWPECFILEDKFFAAKMKHQVNYTETFSTIADCIDQDDRFSLLKLKPPVPSRENRRLVRQDFVDSGRTVSFTVSCPPPDKSTPVSLTLNGKSLGSFNATSVPHSYHVELTKGLSIPIVPNEFIFTSPAPVLLTGFTIDR